MSAAAKSKSAAAATSASGDKVIFTRLGAVTVDDNVRTIFSRMDVDSDGTLAAEELCSAMKIHRRTLDSITALFDKDSDGRFNIDEFTVMWKFISQWKVSFRSVDRDGSGQLSKEEIFAALDAFKFSLSRDAKEALFAAFDRDDSGSRGDGTIDFNEYVQLIVTLNRMKQEFEATGFSGFVIAKSATVAGGKGDSSA